MDRRRFLSMAAAGSGALVAATNPSAAGALTANGRLDASGNGDPASRRGASPSEASAVKVTAARIEEALDEIERLAPRLLKQTGMPGLAVAVVHDDDVVFAEGFGVKKVGTKGRVDADTVFQLASLSKSVASTVVAGVVGEGTVSWDDPIVKYLPDFELSDPYVTQHVTIADMFSHRSGLPDHAGDLIEDLGYDQATILERLRSFPLHAFRSEYAYTNFGLTAAALAVARAKNMSWEDLSEQLLYAPLGMKSTSSRFSVYESSPERAYGHVKIDGKWVAKDVRDADAQTPAGGVSASVNDMAKWMRLQLAEGRYRGKRVIDADALLETHTPHMLSGPPMSPSSRSSFYGLGIGVNDDQAGRVRLSHSGAFALGAGTNYALMPSAGLGMVALGNGMPIGVPEALSFSFYDVVETGKVQRNWYKFLYPRAFAPLFVNPSELADKQPPANATPPLGLASYAGQYVNDLYGPAEVVVVGNALALLLGPQPTTFPLTHWDANTFSYHPAGENAEGVAAVTFTVGPGGDATALNLENLDGEDPTQPLGTFVRG